MRLGRLAVVAALAAPLPAAAPARPVTDADLQGPIDAPSLAGAREAFAAGRYGEAAERLAGAEAPEARLLGAVALVRADRAAEALARLDGLEELLPEVADRVRLLRGRAQEARGEPRAAAAAYGAVPAGSLVREEAALARARVLESAGDAGGALEALEPLLGLEAPREPSRQDAAATALLAAARLRAAAGSYPQARRHLLACWAGHPLAPESAACLARLAKLPGGAGPPGDEDRLRRAEALLEAHRNREALAELGRLGRGISRPGPEEPLACRAALARGRAHRKERAYARAREALGPVAARCPDPGVRAPAMYLLASAAAASGLPSAADEYLALARAFPDHALSDDALLRAAEIRAREDRTEEAMRLLAELADRHPDGDMRPEALFRLAWIAWRGGDADRAAAALGRMESEYRDRDAYEHARAAYWRARVLASRGKDGDEAAARAIFADLAWRSPTDYYGLLARARLAERSGSPPGADTVRPGSPPPGFAWRPGPLAADRHLWAGIALLRSGLDAEAAEELAAVDRARLLEQGGEPLALLTELLDRAGDHRTAHQILRTAGRHALRQRPEGKRLRLWQVAFPPAYRVEVDRWAPQAGVPAELLQALMREESALEPAAVSPAGAVGLTQLMLPTAREVARRLGLSRPSQADLVDPELNVRLGAAYLGWLARRLGGSAPLAVAAYNAGETTVRRWLSSRGHLPLDEFVEEIPVEETRGYVKRVMRSYATYRFLYGGPAEQGLRLTGRLVPGP